MKKNTKKTIEKNKRILLTGIGGFIGSQFMSYALEKTDWDIVGIASWKHQGHRDKILENENYKKHSHRVELIIHDLSEPITDEIMAKIGKIDYIVNIASDCDVERGINNPVPMVKNNLSLMLHMLEYARKIKPEIFLHLSTDEIYGPSKKGTSHKEWSTILPSSPYSASKAAQEAIGISYWRTYGVPLVLINLMNVFGERQHTEKYQPYIISKIMKNEPVIVHGNKKTIGSRFYISGRNASDALLFIMKMKPEMYKDGHDRPTRFHIRGDKEVDNLELPKLIAKFMKKELKYEMEDFHVNRPGHDLRYALDHSKLKKMGWSSPTSFEQSLKEYVEWAIRPENGKWL